MPRAGAAESPARLQHVYTPRGAAQELFTDHSPEILVCGPAGTGKSLACLEKLMLVALKYPGARLLIARKTQVSLASSALDTWRKLVVKELLGSGAVRYYGGGPQDPPQYRFPNGSIVNIGGMDKASRIMSTEYDIVFVQEATELTETDWEALTTRLRNWVVPYQQIIADCNPAHPTHWLKQRADAGRLKLYNSRHEDNPALFDDAGEVTPNGGQYIAKLDALTGVRGLRLRKGQWAAAEGVIYDEWDEEVHLIDRFEIPLEWDRYWSVDFGFKHPFVCQMWAEDPEERLYLYREFYHTGRLVEEHARTILAAVTHPRTGRWIEPAPVRILADPADAEGRATFAKHLGVGNQPAHKAVKEGIQAVQSRLKLRGDGKPGLFILRDSRIERDPFLADLKYPTCTAEEVPGYVWAGGESGRPSKEQPVKEYDDGMDAMRYMVADRDLGSEVRVRFL